MLGGKAFVKRGGHCCMRCGAGKSQDSFDKVLNDSVCDCSCKLTAHNVQATVCTCVFQLQGSSALVYVSVKHTNCEFVVTHFSLLFNY